MNFTPEQLARLTQTPHMDLMLQRGRARQANDNALDQQLAPYEHQAFAREYVGQHPISGALGVGGGHSAVPTRETPRTGPNNKRTGHPCLTAAAYRRVPRNWRRS